MCGIVGALAFGKLNKRDEKIQQRLMRYFTTELLLETVERGPDATGAAVLFNDGNFAGIKRGEESNKFLAKFGVNNKERYGSLLEIWRQHDHPAKVFLGHCRKGTIGDKEDNENNHPIKIKNIVGVHNGVIRNDDDIEKHLGCKRDGKVDSEIIFRLFDHFTNSGKEPFTMDMLEAIIARLTGAFAVLTFNADNINQLPVFRDGRPLEMIFIKELALLIVVSELKFWSRVHFRYERMIEYGEVKLPSLLDMTVEKEVFKDDTAAIFDLNIKCTKDTKIEDLGEFKKISRINKIWTNTIALNRSNTGATSNYTGGQKMAETEKQKRDAEKERKKKAEEEAKRKANKEAEDKNNNVNGNKAEENGNNEENVDGEKKRVFDKLTKKYEIKIVQNPNKMGKRESKVIPIETAGNEDTTVKKKARVTFEEDDVSEETPNKNDSLELDDLTDYDTNDVDNEPADSIDVEFTEVNEVDMTTVDPTLLAKADEAYKDLPNDKRGYGDIETLLNDVNIKTEKVANELGMKIISNRVARLQWIRGFIAGWKALLKESTDVDAKTKLREKHIDGLKSMVVILAQFFARSKSEGRKRSNKSEESLISIAEDHIAKRPSFNMDKLNGVFNIHESGKISEARALISKVAQSTNEGENNQ